MPITVSQSLVTSSNPLYCLTYSTKLKDIQFTMIYNRATNLLD